MGTAIRHQCIIYEGSPSVHLPRIAAVAAEKLGANNRCLYLNSPAMVAGFRSYLAAAGLDVAREVERGALVLSSEQDHLRDGRFDVALMLNALKDALDQALKSGYAGLWATGDMLWELGGGDNLEKLLEYECRLEELLQQNPGLSGICQYHRETLPAHAIETALSAHQAVYINETLSRMNPFYTDPRAPRQRRPEAIGAGIDKLLEYFT